MGGRVRTLTIAAAIAVVTSPTAVVSLASAAAAPDEGGPTRVPLRAALRQCDFSPTAFAVQRPPGPSGTASSLIHKAGSQVVAEVSLVNPGLPGMHYDVGLIQAPRPSSSPCGPGDPGTTFTGLDLDGSGRGTVTIKDTVRQGTTGVWVIVQRPNSNSQNPAEFYTSEFIASI